jgi:hypothetical protein
MGNILRQSRHLARNGSGTTRDIKDRHISSDLICELGPQLRELIILQGYQKQSSEPTKIDNPTLPES